MQALIELFRWLCKKMMLKTASELSQRVTNDINAPWRAALPALLFALLWLLVCYWGTVASMMSIWARSETFAHGFVVPLITVWLIWRKRAQLASLTPRPAWWALLPMAVSGLAWLLGGLASVNSLVQFALVAMLVLAVPIVLGTQVTRVIAFPLCFLFFAVPIGEFMLPQLMAWTADFTVFALRLTGIPVYREGQNFSIPSGNWSVVEACSGIRYLIASLVIGSLYAYLNYQSLLRRLIFIGFAFLVPIFANWVRAYLIVMIGDLSGNRLATGVDHLVYGWLFFGLVVSAMFWIGARWREDSAAPKPAMQIPAWSASARVPTARLWLAVAAVAGIAGVWKSGDWVIERSYASRPPQFAQMAPIDGWLEAHGGLSDWRPDYKDPSVAIHQNYHRANAAVGLYIGYYRNQSSERKLVSSTNTLVTSRDPRWTEVKSGTLEVSHGGQPLDVRTAELRGVAGDRMVVWQWYWVDDRLTASDSWAKAYTSISRLRGRGDDAAVVIVYAPKGAPGEAEATLSEFLRDSTQAVESALRKTRDVR